MEPELRTRRARKSDVQVVEIGEVVKAQREVALGQTSMEFGTDRVAREEANASQHVSSRNTHHFTPTSVGMRPTQSAIIQRIDVTNSRETGIIPSTVNIVSPQRLSSTDRVEFSNPVVALGTIILA